MKEKIFKVELLGFGFLVIGFFTPIFVDTDVGANYAQTAAPFLSTAAFLLLYSANKMQKTELQLQRRELELQREEITETRRIFIEQEYTMTLQRIESLFFSINKERIRLNETLQKPDYTGANPMIVMNRNITKDHHRFVSVYKPLIEQYVGIIYSMLNVIRNTKIRKDDREILFESLEKQMTLPELVLIKNYLDYKITDDLNKSQYKIIYEYFFEICQKVTIQN